MVTKDEVSKKSTDELREIFANQKDYIVEMTSMVEEELKSRGIDIGAIEIVPVPEKVPQAEIDELAAHRQARGLGLTMMVIGLLILVGLIVSLTKHDAGFPWIAAAAMGGTFVFGYFVWKQHTWAFVLSSILYSALVGVMGINLFLTRGNTGGVVSLIDLALSLGLIWLAYKSIRLAIVRVRQGRDL